MSIPKNEIAIQEFTSLIEKMRKINLHEIDSRILPKSFKPTKVFSLILERISYARKIKAPLMIIAGANGAGKSSAARYFANSEGVPMGEVVSGTQPKHLLSNICKQLAIDPGAGWMMQVETLTRQLKDAPRTIIFDEAQRLNYESFDLLKYLADNSGGTFVLIGSASMISRIERWPDIDSRCPVKVRVEAMDLTEFSNLYQMDGYSDKALAEIHAQTKGVMRNIHYLLAHIEEALQESKITKSQITSAHIQRLAEQVF